MTNREDKTVGYVALHLSQTMFCENGACIVASDQSALNKLLKASSLSPKEFQKRKTPFSAIVQGLTMGGSYAFDRDSFKLFESASKDAGLAYSKEKRCSSVDETEFYFVHFPMP